MLQAIAEVFAQVNATTAEVAAWSALGVYLRHETAEDRSWASPKEGVMQSLEPDQ